MSALAWVASAVSATALAAPPASRPAETRGLVAGTPTTAVTLDGRLDEPAWATAPVYGDFVERVPTPGETPPVRTEVRVLVGADVLYVGVVCYLLPKERPRALELQRDSFGIFSDDAVSLKLDVRRDLRTTIGFVTNPAGTQLDYVTVEGGSFRREFDAIWDVSTSVEPDRWVAEFALPAVALGLPKEGSGRIGLNVTRDHNARLATYDLSPIPPEFGPASPLFYATLDGVGALGGGRPISIIPYALGGYDSPGEFRGQIGGDLRLRLADDVFGEVTLFTDFAQVDLDDPVVNLDRFPLFFPERRPFFLSGIEFFEVGVTGDAQLYFSRRIGLDEGRQTVPLIGGVKAFGTVGDLRFGALTALTDASGGQPGQTASVLRARQNFGEDGHIGVIGTLRTDVGLLRDVITPVAPRFSLGLDGAARSFERRLEIEGFAAVDLEGESLEGGGLARARWRGYHVQPEVSLLVLSPGFDPALGFVRRPGQFTPTASLSWITRTTKYGLQQITVEAEGQVVRSFDTERVLTQTAGLDVDVLLRSGFGLNLYIEAKDDLVEEATVIAGVPVEPDRYRGAFFFASLRTPSGRNPFGQLFYTRNTAFFGGVADTFSGFIESRFGPHLSSTVGGDVAVLSFPGRDPQVAITANGRLSVTPDTLLQLDLLAQANGLEQQAVVLARLRWRYLPGSDLFAVYREVIAWEDGARSERSLTVKIAYRLDALL